MNYISHLPQLTNCCRGHTFMTSTNKDQFCDISTPSTPTLLSIHKNEQYIYCLKPKESANTSLILRPSHPQF